MSIDIGVALTILSVILAIISALTVARNNNRNEGKNDGIIMNDIEYVKRGIDDMRFEQREYSHKMEKKFDKLNETVMEHASEIKQIKIKQEMIEKNKEC